MAAAVIAPLSKFSKFDNETLKQLFFIFKSKFVKEAESFERSVRNSADSVVLTEAFGRLSAYFNMCSDVLHVVMDKYPDDSERAMEHHGELAKQWRRLDKTRPAMVAHDIPCWLCRGRHFIEGCSAFQRLTLAERARVIVERGVCWHCLTGRHVSSRCKSEARCGIAVKSATGIKVCMALHHPLTHGTPMMFHQRRRFEGVPANQQFEEEAGHQPDEKPSAIQAPAAGVIVAVPDLDEEEAEVERWMNAAAEAVAEDADAGPAEEEVVTNQGQECRMSAEDAAVGVGAAESVGKHRSRLAANFGGVLGGRYIITG